MQYVHYVRIWSKLRRNLDPQYHGFSVEIFPHEYLVQVMLMVNTNSTFISPKRASIIFARLCSVGLVYVFRVRARVWKSHGTYRSSGYGYTYTVFYGMGMNVQNFTCVASPTKKRSRFLEQIHDWKHLYVCGFLVHSVILP